MRTGGRTFEAAAFLRRNGADVTRVRKMFRDNADDYRAKADAVSHATIFENHFFNVGGVGEGMEKAGSLFGVGLPLVY